MMPAVQERVQDIETDTFRNEVADIAAYLQDHLGQRITAYLSGLKSPKVVGQWKSGSVRPRETAETRLRTAYQAARFLVEAFDDETARAWFFGSNTRLEDEAPAYLLRHGETPDDFRGIVPVAKRFVEEAR